MATVVKRKRTYNAALRRELAQMTRTRILDAARRLLATGTYSSVTMEQIAKEAGVSSQTVYAVFGNKLRLAQEIIELGFHFEGLEELDARVLETSDPEVLLRGSAQISRLVYESCADLLRFLRESGDPKLLARYEASEDLRLARETFLPDALEKSGRLRAGLSPAEVLAVTWAMTASDLYSMLVFQRGWTPAQYEDWLGSALTSLLLTPQTE